MNGRVRRDRGFPVGITDVVEIAKTRECFRCLYDAKGRFTLKQLEQKEAQFKLPKVRSKALGPNKTPTS